MKSFTILILGRDSAGFTVLAFRAAAHTLFLSTNYVLWAWPVIDPQSTAGNDLWAEPGVAPEDHPKLPFTHFYYVLSIWDKKWK